MALSDLFDTISALGDFVSIIPEVLVDALVDSFDSFWNGVLDFFQETLSMVKQIVDAIINTSKTFIQRIGNQIRIIVRHYYRKNGSMYIHQETKEISRDEVPPDILALAEGGKEVDITANLELC